MRKLLVAAAAALLPVPILAADPVKTVALEAATDPARQAAAKPVIDKLWPLGTYRRMMDGTMSRMMDAMLDTMFAMKASDVLPEDGAKTGDASGGKSMGEMAAAADPHFRERMKISTDVMFAEMLPLMDRIEPGIRESLTRIYARRFTAGQLGEMDRFFSTPTGKAYADQWMMSFVDPEIVSNMQAFAPELMKAMPGIIEKVKKATAHLPPPPKREASDDD